MLQPKRCIAILENADDFICIAAVDGRLEYLNPAGRRLIGVDVGALELSIQQLCPLAQVQQQGMALSEAWARGRWQGDSELLHQGTGEALAVSMSVFLIGDDGEGAPSLVAICRDVRVRKAMEARLLESQSFLDRAQEVAHIGSWISGLGDDPTLFWSNELYRIFGLPVGSPLTVNTFFEGVHPVDRDAIRAAVSRAIEEHASYSLEHRVVRPDGEIRWVLERGDVIRDAADQPVRLVGVAQDITELRRAQEAQAQLHRELARERALLGAVLQQLPVGVVIAEAPSGRVLMTNEALSRITGSPLEGGEGVAHYARFGAVHPDGRPYSIDEYPLSRTLRDGVSLSEETRYRVADGSLATLQLNTSAVRGPSGEVMACVGTCFDLTERKRAEEALRESEERFRAMSETLPNIVFVAGADGRILYLNHRYHEYTGLTPEAALGGLWLDPVHPDDVSGIDARWRAAAASGGEWESRYRLRAAEGGYRWFLGRSRPVRDSSGRIGTWLGSAMDIDDVVRAELELKDADQRKDEFLAMLAHELRNPLAPIRNALELMRPYARDGVLGSSRAILERQVGQLTRIVDDLLDVSRITRGKIELRKELLDLAEVVASALETSRPLIEARRHVLHLQPSPERLIVHADRTRLIQAISNLLNNAAKYTAEGGRIDLSVERKGEEGVLQVRDTGAGLRREELARVFEPFFQGERSLDRSQGGLGIGLTLVRRLMELHGGQAQGESEGPGRGSVFSLHLPLQPAGNASVPAPKPSEREPVREPPSSRRVLVVDDNVDAAESLADLLSLMGNIVEVAYDGFQALERAQASRPDVILLDLGLPRMDGYEVARRIRSLYGDEVLIIALSGYGREEDRRQTRQAGFNHHLVKPADPDAVEALILEASAG